MRYVLWRLGVMYPRKPTAAELATGATELVWPAGLGTVYTVHIQDLLARIMAFPHRDRCTGLVNTCDALYAHLMEPVYDAALNSAAHTIVICIDPPQASPRAKGAGRKRQKRSAGTEPVPHTPQNRTPLHDGVPLPHSVHSLLATRHSRRWLLAYLTTRFWTTFAAHTRGRHGGRRVPDATRVILYGGVVECDAHDGSDLRYESCVWPLEVWGSGARAELRHPVYAHVCPETDQAASFWIHVLGAQPTVVWSNDGDLLRILFEALRDNPALRVLLRTTITGRGVEYYDLSAAHRAIKDHAIVSHRTITLLGLCATMACAGGDYTRKIVDGVGVDFLFETFFAGQMPEGTVTCTPLPDSAARDAGEPTHEQARRLAAAAPELPPPPHGPPHVSLMAYHVDAAKMSEFYAAVYARKWKAASGTTMAALRQANGWRAGKTHRIATRDQEDVSYAHLAFDLCLQGNGGRAGYWRIAVDELSVCADVPPPRAEDGALCIDRTSLWGFARDPDDAHGSLDVAAVHARPVYTAVRM